MNFRVLVILVLLVLMAGSVYGADITVEKSVKEDPLSAGGTATVELRFSNPFGVEVPLVIVDKNILGDNGIDVQCMELTIGKEAESVLQYDPIVLYSSGEYDLDSAMVNYTDPLTGINMSVESDELEVEIEKGSVAGGAQGITTIYQCNGMNMQSTSYSSSNQQQQEQQQKEQQQTKQQQQQAQDKMQQQKDAVQNNQMSQDAGALKQEMAKQREEYAQDQQEMIQKMQNDSTLMEEHQKMLDQGYNMTGAEVDPESSDSGDFKMNYQRPDGETASLSGSMQNGSLDSLEKRSSEMEKQMMEQLQDDARFQEMQKELNTSGFNQTDVSYDLLGNQTQMSVSYENPDGLQANVTADFVNQTITSVNMEKEEEKDYRKMGFFTIVIALLLAAMYLLYRKHFGPKKEVAVDEGELAKDVNYRKISKKMIADAKKLFADGREKDAYELVGRAVRFYYTHKLGYRKEMTNTQTVAYLRRHKLDHSRVQKGLNMCGMVEFAKYKANKKDFDMIVKIAEETVSKK